MSPVIKGVCGKLLETAPVPPAPSQRCTPRLMVGYGSRINRTTTFPVVLYDSTDRVGTL